jgi:hypothetical protein
MSHSEELHSERNASKHCEELIMRGKARTASATATAGQRFTGGSAGIEIQ